MSSKKNIIKFLKKNGLKYKDLFVQFFKFGMVGLSSVSISLFIYFIFINFNKNYYILGSLVGWIVSVANAFYWNNKFVFSEKNNFTVKNFLKSYLSYGFSFIIATLMLLIEVEIFMMSEKLAPFVNLIITIPINYILNKIWIFK